MKSTLRGEPRTTQPGLFRRSEVKDSVLKLITESTLALTNGQIANKLKLSEGDAAAATSALFKDSKLTRVPVRVEGRKRRMFAYTPHGESRFRVQTEKIDGKTAIVDTDLAEEVENSYDAEGRWKSGSSDLNEPPDEVVAALQELAAGKVEWEYKRIGDWLVARIDGRNVAAHIFFDEPI